MFSDCFPCVSCFCGLFQLPCGAVCCVRAEWLTHLSHLPMQMQEAVASPSAGNMTPSQLQRGHNEHPLDTTSIPLLNCLVGHRCLSVPPASRDRRASPSVSAERRKLWRSRNAALPHSSTMCFRTGWQCSPLNLPEVGMTHTGMAEYPSSAWGAVQEAPPVPESSGQGKCIFRVWVQLWMRHSTVHSWLCRGCGFLPRCLSGMPGGVVAPDAHCGKVQTAHCNMRSA